MDVQTFLHPKSAPHNPVVLCFGDSWSYGNAYGLRQVFSELDESRGFALHQKDFMGWTAERFAEHKTLLPLEVSNTKADYVVLSLGGNDFKNIYWKKKQYATLPSSALSAIEVNIRIVLDELYKEHPEIRVVMYGYDFPGSIGDVLAKYHPPSFSSTALHYAYQYLGVPLINKCALQFGGLLASLATDYSSRGYHFTYIPLWGTLQQAAAKAQGEKSSFGYRLTEPSPDEFMKDPIHANGKGCHALMQRLYEEYFEHEFTAQLIVGAA